jgi:hypothetical protein
MYGTARTCKSIGRYEKLKSIFARKWETKRLNGG